jgi:hypothetical protein
MATEGAAAGCPEPHVQHDRGCPKVPVTGGSTGSYWGCTRLSSSVGCVIDFLRWAASFGLHVDLQRCLMAPDHAPTTRSRSRRVAAAAADTTTTLTWVSRDIDHPEVFLRRQRVPTIRRSGSGHRERWATIRADEPRGRAKRPHTARSKGAGKSFGQRRRRTSVSEWRRHGTRRRRASTATAPSGVAMKGLRSISAS